MQPGTSRRTRRASLRRRLRDELGQDLVEFALPSTMFFATVFGTTVFGLAVWQYNMMADLAQEGARYAVVHGKSSSSPASAADVEAYVQGRAVGITGITCP